MTFLTARGRGVSTRAGEQEKGILTKAGRICFKKEMLGFTTILHNV